MKPHELYKAVDPATINQMLEWFRSNDKNVYKHCVATLANARKLRPVFVEKKSIADQYKWILQTLQLRASDAIGEHLLQAWFMAGHQAMLAGFCDALGILHDGKGSIQGDLPKALDHDRLQAGVEKLLKENDPKIVAVYLHVFNMQSENGWENLNEILASNPSLALA